MTSSIYMCLEKILYKKSVILYYNCRTETKNILILFILFKSGFNNWIHEIMQLGYYSFDCRFIQILNSLLFLNFYFFYVHFMSFYNHFVHFLCCYIRSIFIFILRQHFNFSFTLVFPPKKVNINEKKSF